jgi:DNA-binding PadR family transcriptional regulator
MMQLESDVTWIRRGRQKSAVAQVLRRPMTPSEIWQAARSHNRHIQLRDVWFILREGTRRGLMRRLGRREVTGKVYYWTDHGRAVLGSTFAIALPPPPQGITWAKYSLVMRSKMRRLVLLELAQMHLIGDRAKTAARVRQSLKEKYPVSLNSVIRALKELRSSKLVDACSEAEKRGQKVYRLSGSGERITTMLIHRTDSPQTLLNSSASVST